MTMQSKTIFRQIYRTTQATLAVCMCMLAIAVTAQARDMYQGTLETVFTDDGHHLSLHLCRLVSADFRLVVDPSDADSAKLLDALKKLRLEKDTPINVTVVGDVTNKATPPKEDHELSVLNYEVGGFKHCGFSELFGEMDTIAPQETDYAKIEALINNGDVKQANKQLKKWLADLNHPYATENPSFIIADGYEMTKAEVEKACAEMRLFEIRKDIDAQKQRQARISKWENLPYRASNYIVNGKYHHANAQLKSAISDIGASYVPKKGELDYSEDDVDTTPQQLTDAQQDEASGKLRAAAIKRLAVFHARFNLLKNK